MRLLAPRNRRMADDASARRFVKGVSPLAKTAPVS
jgi:hypothetical protein